LQTDEHITHQQNAQDDPDDAIQLANIAFK
jgi:hypothetical protein